MAKKKAARPEPEKKLGIFTEAEAKKLVPIKEDKKTGGIPVLMPLESVTWLPLFKTQIEDASGEQYLAIIEQNVETKDIRTVKV
jgi:hypothetical protein